GTSGHCAVSQPAAFWRALNAAETGPVTIGSTPAGASWNGSSAGVAMAVGRSARPSCGCGPQAPEAVIAKAATSVADPAASAAKRTRPVGVRIMVRERFRIALVPPCGGFFHSNATTLTNDESPASFASAKKPLYARPLTVRA